MIAATGAEYRRLPLAEVPQQEGWNHLERVHWRNRESGETEACPSSCDTV